MRPWTTTWLLSAMLAGLSTPGAFVAAEELASEPCATARTHDQIWLISTRQLDCCDGPLPAAPRLHAWKYDQKRNDWRLSSIEEFLATDDPEVPTNIFVHGNWLTFSNAIRVGFTYYKHQAEHAPTERPLRLVLWTWPSDQDDRPLRDVRVKYRRTDSEGRYLGWFLSRIGPRVKVSLLGYSFGGTIITGALHGLAIEHAAKPPADQVQREPCRAVLLVAAVDECVLAEGQDHALALTQVDRLLVVKNGCDPVLKRFRYIDRCARPEALGYWGAADVPAEHARKVHELDASGVVGKLHHWRPFVTEPSLIVPTLPYVWFSDAWPAAPSVAMPMAKAQ